jgi:hypothetical protein
VPLDYRSCNFRLKTKHFLALFRKIAIAFVLIDVERREHVFSSALPLYALQLIHSAIKLPVEVSFVAEEFVA